MAIVVPIVSQWNGKGLDKAIAEINKAQGGFAKFSRTMDIASASFIKTGKDLTRNVTLPLAGLAIAANKSITDASNLAEAQSKVNAVFKTQAKDVLAWSKTMSGSFGVSTRAAAEAAGTYGNLFQAFGIGEKESAKMSKKLVELAADMASFNNVPIDEALTALRSGLSGETEPLKRFGVALNDVRLRQEAAALGLGTYTGMLPVAVKAQAAYALILRDTALQQGDVARTAGGLANQKKFLAAQVEDLSGSFGAVLMPVMINVVGVLRNSVLPQIQKLIEAFKTLSPNAIVTATEIGLFAAALGPAMVAMGYFIKIVNGVGNAFVFMTKRIVLIPAVLLLMVSAIVKSTDATMSWGQAVFKTVRGIVVGFAAVGNAVIKVINTIGKAENAFAAFTGQSKRFTEITFNFNSLVGAVDSGAAALSSFNAEMKKDQANLSAIAAQANALADSLSGSGGAASGSKAGSVAKASNTAKDAIAAFKDSLDSAKQSLSDAKTAFSDFAKSVSGSITSVINFGSAANAETGTFLENLVAQAAKAKDFGNKVQQLLTMGLSQSAIGQVLAAGADAGTKIADEIIAGGAGVVNQVNTLIDATQSLADQVGQAGASQFYSAGVAQGEAMVQGVVDAITRAGFSITPAGEIVNQKAIDTVNAQLAAFRKSGNKLTKKEKKKITDLANSLGVDVPAMAKGGIVTSPTLALIGEAGPEAVVPLNKSNAMGTTINISVNAGLGADGVAIGRQIVDEIKRYERSSGKVFASA